MSLFQSFISEKVYISISDSVLFHPNAIFLFQTVTYFRQIQYFYCKLRLITEKENISVSNIDRFQTKDNISILHRDLRRAYDKFSDFFLMDTFIDSIHMKL